MRRSADDVPVLPTVQAMVKRFVTQGAVPLPRSQHACAIVRDTMFVFGGQLKTQPLLNELFMLHLTSMVWVRLCVPGGFNAMDARVGASAALLDNVLLIVGGNTHAVAQKGERTHGHVHVDMRCQQRVDRSIDRLSCARWHQCGTEAYRTEPLDARDQCVCGHPD